MLSNVFLDYHTLSDFSSTGVERPWSDKKNKSLLVAKSYQRLGYFDKFKKIEECGTFLEFKRFTNNDLKLNTANFCKVRLCPMCSWRRSLKIFGQVSKIMNVATADSENAFLFLTLTIRNCTPSELPKALDLILKGYDTMFKRKKVKQVILGAFRALEITHNTNVYSKSYDTYHPHLHCILMVKKSYFNCRSGSYIKQSEWVDLWKSCIDVDYEPIVHIEKINDNSKNIEKAVAETAKYSVKDSDLIVSDLELQDKTISVLDESLSGRRLISFRGSFAKIQKDLKLDDAMDGDLVNCDIDDEINKDLEFVIERYRWHIGYRNYVLLDDNNEFS